MYIKRWFIKIIKNTGLVLTGALEFCFLLYYLLVLGMQTSIVQNWFATEITNLLSKSLSAEIKIGRAGITFFNRLVLEEVDVRDRRGDSLLYARQAEAGFDVYDLLKGEMRLNSVCLTNPKIRLYREEREGELNADFILRALSPDSLDKSEFGKFELNHIEIRGGSFRFDNEFEKAQTGFDVNHISASAVNAYLGSVVLLDDQYTAEEVKISFISDSLEVRELSTALSVSSRGIRADNLRIVTSNSEIRGKVSTFSASWKDYGRFPEAVRFSAEILPTEVSMTDLSYFIRDLEGLNDRIRFSGEFRGSIADLEGRNVFIALSDHTKIEMDFGIKGLPDAEESNFNLNIKELISSREGLEQINIPPFREKKHLVLPDNISTLGRMVFRGNIRGRFNDLNVRGDFATDIGSVYADLAIRNDSVISYSGSVKAKAFNAGLFLGTGPVLGRISLVASLKGSGLKPKEVDARIDGSATSIVLNGYEYRNVLINGNFLKETFHGMIKINDPHVKVDFTGEVALAGKEKKFDFDAKITGLYPRIVLGLENVDSSAMLSADIKIDFAIRNIDSLLGSLIVSNIRYSDAYEEITTEDLVFRSMQENDQKSLSVRSGILDFDVSGKYDMLDGFKTFRNIMGHYFPALGIEEVVIDKDFRFSLLVKDYRLPEKLFTHGLWLDSGSTVNGRYRSSDNHMDFNATLLGSHLQNFHIDTCILHLSSDKNEIVADGRVSHFSYGSKTEKRLIDIRVSAGNNRGEASFNITGLNAFRSDLTVKGRILDEKNIQFGITRSSFSIGNDTWTIPDSNLIEYTDGNWIISGLALEMEDQRADIGGTYTRADGPAFSLAVQKFNLAMLNPILENFNLSFRGIINGNAEIKKQSGLYSFTSDLEFSGVEFNGIALGGGHLISNWNDAGKSLDVDGKISLPTGDILLVKGRYMSRDEISPLQFEISLGDLPLKVLEPLADVAVSQFGGSCSGRIMLTGKLSSPDLRGNVDLKDASLLVNYTNVEYRIANCEGVARVPVKLTPDSIIIPAFCALDESGRKAVGSISFVHDRFSKFDIDLGLTADKILALNTNIRQNELYYGRAYASGTIDIRVSSEMTRLNLDIVSEDGTLFNLPVGTSSVSENRFIVFEQRISDLRKEKEEEKAEEAAKIDLRLKVKATPMAVIRLVFDETKGDVIETRGSGDLVIAVDPKKGMSMLGEYEIVSGTYMFTLQTIVNKKFSIDAGSKIRWNGDPYNGEMDITTSYKVKTRLYDILPEIDPDFNYRKKVPVVLRLRMTESVTSPIISFSVFLPESKEGIRSQLNTELSNENCLNQQVFSLLILGAFTPCEAKTDNTANTNVGKNTAYETMSNQLSSWLSKISNDVDVDFTYRPETEGEEYSSEQVEVALSTQLFNDRLIIDGNVGYGNQTGTTQNTKDWAGEFTIEYKIRSDGKLRVKAFNKVNDRAYVENDNLYIQGVGLKYTHDFGKQAPHKTEGEGKNEEGLIREEDDS